MTEHALDNVALLVGHLVVVVLDFAVLARQDALCTPRVEPFAQGLAVIAFVGDEFGGWRDGFDVAPRDLAIVNVSSPSGRAGVRQVDPPGGIAMGSDCGADAADDSDL